MFQAISALKGSGGESGADYQACNTDKTFEAGDWFPVRQNYFIGFRRIFFSIVAAAFSAFFRRLNTLRI